MKNYALFILAACFTQHASAHITLEQASANAGAYQKLTFKVGHGCEGSSTNSITVRLPDGVMGAKPMPKPGWKINVVTEALTKPYQSHGKTISKDVSEISWNEGSLPDAYYDEFSIQVKLPDTPGKLYFKITQLCEKGRLDWVEIPKEGQSRQDLKAPAPMLEVTTMRGGAHQH
jgi:hypothetical protein